MPDLTGRTIATLGAPSLGAVRLAELYPNPLRQPVIIEVDNSQQAVERVLYGQSRAAIVPTPVTDTSFTNTRARRLAFFRS